MQTVLQCKQDLTGIIHGTTLNKVVNLDRLFFRAGSKILMDIDPQETKRIVQLANPLYNEVFDYACPSDVKGNAIIDIRPQANRQLNSVATQSYNQAFDVSKSKVFNNQFTINFNQGIKTLRVSLPILPAGTIVNECDAIVANGTWSANGTASNLRVDNVNFASGSGSLEVDFASGANPSTGGFVNSTIPALDLTTFKNQGSFFLYVYLPTASNFNSVTLKWGSSASNYYSKTVTVTQENTTFVNGWNLLAFNWLGASQTGTPDVTKISYVEVDYSYNGTAQTGVRLDGIVARMGLIYELEYYSRFMFADSSTGAFQEYVTDDSNFINLDTEAYGIFLNQLSYLTQQQLQGLDAMFFDSNFFYQGYQEDIAKYKLRYRSEIQKPQSQYYVRPKPGYMQYVNPWGYK